MAKDLLTPEQEAEAQVLAERIRQASAEEFLQMARLLVGKQTSNIFGATEFQRRERLLRLGAQVDEEYLREKSSYEGAGVICPTCQREGQVSRLRPQGAGQLIRSDRLSARLLLLRTLWSRSVPLG
jgi:hypothetical protein